MGGSRTAAGAVRTGVTALAAVAVLALGACGDQQAGGPTVSSTPSSSSTPGGTPPGGTSAAAGASSLTVVLDDGVGTTSTWTLTCAADGTPGGDHPDAGAACAALTAAGTPFAPVRKGTACTMVYGGPQTATVRGTWNGEAVAATFDRTDGCQISRWDRIAPLLQPGTTAGRSAGAS